MRYFRKNHDEKPTSPVPKNPFPSAVEPGPRIIEFDPGPDPGIFSDAEDYISAIEAGARQFPWFSEYRVAPADGIAHELRRRTVPGLRRVLFSYLGGRPMKQVANRIPTSRRSVYQHIKGAVYFGDIHGWNELGLIRLWATPKFKVDPNVLLPDGWLDEDHTPVICLMCHRSVGHIKLWERPHDSSLLEAADIQYEYGSRAEEEIRGHLISHFFLGGRPKPNESWETVLGWISYNPGKYLARRWLDQVDPVAITTAHDHRRLTLPVVDGRPPTEDQVRAHYRALL